MLPCQILDRCCGCGALGLALHAAVPGIRLYAAEIEPAASLDGGPDDLAVQRRVARKPPSSRGPVLTGAFPT